MCVRVSMFAVSTMCVRVSADPLSSALCVVAAFVRYLCAALCLINAASSLNVCAATSRTMHKFGRVTANPAYSLCRSTSLPFLTESICTAAYSIVASAMAIVFYANIDDMAPDFVNVILVA